MMINTIPRILVRILAASGILVCCITTIALPESEGTKAELNTEQVTRESTTTHAAALQQVFIDPETGERRLPTADQLLGAPADLLKGISGLPESDQLTVREDGMMILEHGIEQINFSRVHRHEDGTVSTECHKPQVPHAASVAPASEQQE